jgi:cyclopropane fatty-acyl-phospholipid synthase-like methyltransferase
MNDSIYKKSFKLFLRKTDEKSVIKKFIIDNISLNKKTNFLDIGAGDGSLASIISRKVKSTLVVEPNQGFYKQLIKHKKIRVLNKIWEEVHLNESFDFILAAYVVTYFSKTQREQLIKKMYNMLNSDGSILILSVDAQKGSWRKIHTYFYKLINHKHHSSDNELKRIMRKYGAVLKSFKTHVIAKNSDEMLEILGFDFYKYSSDFLKFSPHLKKFMKKYSDTNGAVTLEMVHNAYIITKK